MCKFRREQAEIQCFTIAMAVATLSAPRAHVLTLLPKLHVRAPLKTKFLPLLARPLETLLQMLSCIQLIMRDSSTKSELFESFSTDGTLWRTGISGATGIAVLVR